MDGDFSEKSGTPVILISMPFAPLTPSIALGLLQAGLARERIAAKCLYFGLEFSDLIGGPFYLQVANANGGIEVTDLVGEWIFSSALFGYQRGNIESYCDSFLDGSSGVRDAPLAIDLIQRIKSSRMKVDELLTRCVNGVLSHKPKIIGFTSTFHQHVASLALAKRIKEVASDITIVFGGANVEGLMGIETLRRFKFVDIVVSGEGDIVFPRLCSALLEGGDPPLMDGVVTRETLRVGGNIEPSNAIVTNMDTLPVPDYTDFFDQMKNSSLNAPAMPILFESSRGCWWGVKHHCTFCGLNGTHMAYRSKGAERIFEEIKELSNRHPGLPLSAVDNILDMKYIKTLLPLLASLDRPPKLFFEVKANLTKDQLYALKAAGITLIQPGIESFSTNILKLMNKGTSALHNVSLLKWCKEIGITPLWNFLYGFPSESPSDYAAMATLIPMLYHLQAPSGSFSLRLDRFSPYHSNPSNYAIENIKPFPSYSHVYPFSEEIITNLAYYFTFDCAAAPELNEGTCAVVELIKDWKRKEKESILLYYDDGMDITLWDSRPCAVRASWCMTGLKRAIFLTCDAPRTLSQIKENVSAVSGEIHSSEDFKLELQDLLHGRIFIEGNGRFLNLAVAISEEERGRLVGKQIAVNASSTQRSDSTIYL